MSPFQELHLPTFPEVSPAVILPMNDTIPFAGAASGYSPSSPLGQAVSQNSDASRRLRRRRRAMALSVPPLAATATTASPTSSAVSSTSSASAAINCLDSSNTEQQINSLFSQGGPGTIVALCPSAVLLLNSPVQLTATNQSLITRGLPTGDTRAILRVMGVAQTNAITASCGNCHYATIRNVQFDGSRPLLGQYNIASSALLEMGGPTTGQLITQINAYEPRGWSVLHAIEGNLNCQKMKILNNTIGPSGYSPTGSAQERLRREVGTHNPGEWADGISLACTNSLVQGNTVVDATDGAIVVFGAPGSTITGNLIVANERVLMGGVNLVDFGPYSGTFQGTEVTGNTFLANTTMIKIGVAIGVMSWGSNNATSSYTRGGKVSKNTFTSGSSAGYFGYGVTVAGHFNATVSTQSFSNANFGGVVSPQCTNPSPVAPAPLLFDPFTTLGAALPLSGTTGSALFRPAASMMFYICMAPTANMTSTGITQ
ncbi:hypothetical protein RQP46_008785 [Phenoliferia psychrophenolica]